MYHISDIKRFLRCERLYLFRQEEENTYNAYLRSDESITDLLAEYYRMDAYFTGIRNDPADRFLLSIDSYEWFLRPRITYGELRVTIPLLHKREEGFEVVFLYYNTEVRDPDLLTYRISVQALEALGLHVSKVSVLTLRKDYVYHGRLQVDELFEEHEEYKGVSYLDLIRRETFDIDGILWRMRNVTEDEKPAKKKRACKTRGVCEHYYRCFPEMRDLPDDSILTLVSSQNKEEMYEKGIRHLREADITLLEGNPLQYAQIMADRNGGLFADRLLLKSWMEPLEKRPVSFIDFEWDRYLIPPYEGMRPLDVVCFEFALYILKEDNTLSKYTFLATGDCRKDFVEALIRYLPEEGPVLAYNAIGAEVLRLKELSVIYPEYAEALSSIISRFMDLSVPFTEGMVYDIRMRGDLTLKKLVSMVSDLSYHDLDIDNGMKAVYSWRDVDKGLSSNSEETLASLEEYCSLDAYGLYLVYCWLNKIVNE